MKEAMYYKKTDNKDVLCMLCPHNCKIMDGKRGICNARQNEGGVLYTLNYNKVTSLALDPIEKKPLYHFYPGSHILSAGTFGCNLKCSFCQNYQISQKEAETEEITSSYLVNAALKQKDSIGIAYTYNEPFIWYEFVFETAKLAKEKRLKNVLVTNGFINEEPLKEILPYIDAMNIDIKGFTDKYYKDVCKGLLEPVKRTVETAAASCHIEITTLVVTDLNDSMNEISEVSRWLSDIDKDIPFHITRYFPNYKLSNNPTPVSTLIDLKEEAQKYLNYVYIGNVWGLDNTTFCPDCGNPLIKRDGSIEITGLIKGCCKRCGRKINIY